MDMKPLELARLNRDCLLKNSDWRMLPDSPLTDAQRAAWATYRQALRDLPETNADSNKWKWPKVPT